MWKNGLLIFTHKAPLTIVVAIAANQDQAAQNVQLDLWSALSALLQYCRHKQQWYLGQNFRMKMSGI